jgi:hypothetical protein
VACRSPAPLLDHRARQCSSNGTGEGRNGEGDWQDATGNKQGSRDMNEASAFDGEGFRHSKLRTSARTATYNRTRWSTHELTVGPIPARGAERTSEEQNRPECAAKPAQLAQVMWTYLNLVLYGVRDDVKIQTWYELAHHNRHSTASSVRVQRTIDDAHLPLQ